MRTLAVCVILFSCSLLIGCKGIAYKVVTANMSPALNPGDAFTANPFEYSDGSTVKRFDIVVFQAPEDVKKMFDLSGDVRYTMRVIGLPGEKLEIRDNRTYINGQLVNEPFETIFDEKDRKKNFPAITIPEEEYFLMGDNRPNSMDCRYFARPTISKKDIYKISFQNRVLIDLKI